MPKDFTKLFFAKWQKPIFLVFAIGCLIVAAVTISVGYSLFSARPVLFGVFVFYVVILVGVVIWFGRRFIAMIGE
ncbi:MAG: hypothetical protein AAB035_00460 [Nitrospirota bacterium]